MKLVVLQLAFAIIAQKGKDQFGDEFDVCLESVDEVNCHDQRAVWG